MYGFTLHFLRFLTLFLKFKKIALRNKISTLKKTSFERYLNQFSSETFKEKSNSI